MNLKMGKVNGDSTWWAVRGSSKRLWHVHSRGETGWQGEEQAVNSPECWCLVCGADGFWGSGKSGLLQCKNERNFCLELGCFGGRWVEGLLSDIAPIPRSRETYNSQEKRHVLKQRHFSAIHWTKQCIKSWHRVHIACCEAKKWMFLLKHLAMKWEVTEGPVTCGGIKEEILRVVTYFKDIIKGESSGQMFAPRHWNIALQWQENMQKMCGC